MGFYTNRGEFSYRRELTTSVLLGSLLYILSDYLVEYFSCSPSQWEEQLWDSVAR